MQRPRVATLRYQLHLPAPLQVLPPVCLPAPRASNWAALCNLDRELSGELWRSCSLQAERHKAQVRREKICGGRCAAPWPVCLLARMRCRAALARSAAPPAAQRVRNRGRVERAMALGDVWTCNGKLLGLAAKRQLPTEVALS